jgi:hypothetical protein
MHFNNIENISVFDSFFDNYSELINSIINESQSSEIIIISSKHRNAGFFIGPDDYFTTNPIMTKKNIAYNQYNCDKIRLTIIEKYAFIAHELGHIYDSKIYQTDDNLTKEINADEMACKIGLQDDLICGLQKLMDSNTHIELTNNINKRISYRKSKSEIFIAAEQVSLTSKTKSQKLI